MAALLHNVAVLHHKNHVRLADGGKAVRHNKAGTALHHAGKGFLDTHLGASINRGCCFVQDQHRRQAEHHAGNAQQLLLALTDVAAVLGDDGIVALRQAADEAVCMGGFGCCHDLFKACIRLAVGNVFPHGTGPQPCILQHHAVAAAQGSAGHIPDVGAGHLDGTAVHIIEAHEQVDEGGLAAAGRADDGNALAGLYVEGKALDQRAVGQVAEGNILQLHMAVRLQNGGVLDFRHLIVGIQQLEHAGGAGQSVLQLRHHAGDLVEGLGVLVGVAQKHAQLADGDAAPHRVHSTHKAHACVHDVIHKAGGRVGQAGKEDGLQAHVLQTAIHLVKGGKALGLVAEGLHHLLALDHLVDQRGLLAAHGALALEVTIAALGKEACHHEAQRGDAHHHQRDGHILAEHEQQGAEDGQNAAEQLCKAHQQAVRKGIHIGHHAADDIAGRMAVEVGKRQGLNFAQGFVAQVAADKEGDAIVAHAQQPLCKSGHTGNHQHLDDNAHHTAKIYGTLTQHHINGAAAEDGDIQLCAHAHSSHYKAAHHKQGIRFDLAQNTGQGGLALLRGQLCFCFCTHFCASPFLNWLS